MVSKSKWIFYFLNLVAGTLYGLSYFPYSGVLIIPALAIIFSILDYATHTKTKWLAFLILSLTSSLVTLHWMFSGLQNYLQPSWWQTSVATLFFALLANVIFVISLALSLWTPLKFIKSRSVYLIIFFTLGSYTPTLFVPHHFSFQWISLNLIGANSLTIIGQAGLHIVTLLMAYFIYRSFKSSFKYAMPAAALFLATQGLGYFISQKHLPAAKRTLKVLAVQGQKDFAEFPEGKIFETQRLQIFDRYVSLTEKSLNEMKSAKPDLIIWPESVFPEVLESDYNLDLSLKISRRLVSLKNFTANKNIPILFGAMTGQQESYFNSTVMIEPTSNTMTIHQKKVLMPVGEKLPLGLNFFADYLGFKSYYKVGDRQDIFSLNNIFFDVQICYEILFLKKTDLSSQTQFIVNVTNDMWFNSPIEAYQHLTWVRAKAIETNRPILRVTNTGYSAFIDQFGNIKAITPLNEALTKLFEISF